MVTYLNDEFVLSIQYPADWEVLPEDDDWKARFLGGEGAAFGIGIQDFGDETPVSLTPEQHHELITNVIIEHWLPAGSGHRILSVSKFGEIDGRPLHVALVTTSDGRENIAVLTYLSATGVSYRVVCEMPASGLDELVPMFDYLIRSIAINGNPLTDAPQFPSFETDSSDDAQPSPESSEVQSPYGPMAIYRDDEFGFSMQYPAAWEVVPEDDEWKAQFISDVGNVLAISIIDGRKAGVSDWTAYIYAAEVIAYYESRGGGARAISNLRYGKINGRPARLIIFSDAGSLGATLLYVSGGSVLYGISFALDASRFDDLTPMFDYLFRTITIDGEPLTDTREFPRLG